MYVDFPIWGLALITTGLMFIVAELGYHVGRRSKACESAVGAVKAIHAARLAMNTDGGHNVSLDQAIETMRQTGRDMQSAYKETSQAGLAVNVIAC